MAVYSLVYTLLVIVNSSSDIFERKPKTLFAVNVLIVLLILMYCEMSYSESTNNLLPRICYE